MIPCKVYLCVTFIVVYVDTAHVSQVNEERIKDLEQEKAALYRQIQQAIDEGVRALRSANDSDVGEGVHHLLALKEQVQETHGDATNNQLSNNTTQRNLRRSPKKKHRGPYDLDEIFEYKNVYKKPEKAKLMLDNRLLLDKKLKEWIAKRTEERQRLKEYLEKKRSHFLATAIERCPRFGLGKKKNGKKMRRDSKSQVAAPGAAAEAEDELDAARILNKKKRKYPCCRKCCKKSYMGCL
ncbi:uncharacterized protein [Battus philenor]|uniref:uncharacterized protein n=1 Tax=Battus philenor TaxID=42288 RepID=UPI0035CF348C